MVTRSSIGLLIICFVLQLQNLFSQIVFQGVITDNGAEYLGNGAEPVANALVTITDWKSDPQRTFTDVTNDLGEYSIVIWATGVDDNNLSKPGNVSLMQNYPNPFNPSTVIGYELVKPSNITIEIHNVLGQKVRTLFDGYHTSGSGQVIWDAVDDFGQGVPAGVYIYSLRAEGNNINKKMLLLDGQKGHSNLSISTAATANVLKPNITKQQSDLYTLQVTNDSIETYEQQNIEVTGNMRLDITVKRTVTDIDGNVYSTVKIGNQWWLAENLKVTHYRNGQDIPHETNNIEWTNLITGSYCNYNNNSNYVAICGRLYTWYAIADSRNIAPVGWHVPTDAEWKELEMYLGMSQAEADTNGWRGTDEGGKLKETGSHFWYGPNTGATNESGFFARPGGHRYYFTGLFSSFGSHAFFWSSTKSYTRMAVRRILYSDSSDIRRCHGQKYDGASVRLIRD